MSVGPFFPFQGTILWFKHLKIPTIFVLDIIERITLFKQKTLTCDGSDYTPTDSLKFGNACPPSNGKDQFISLAAILFAMVRQMSPLTQTHWSAFPR